MEDVFVKTCISCNTEKRSETFFVKIVQMVKSVILRGF